MVAGDHDIGLLLLPIVFILAGGGVLVLLSHFVKFVGLVSSKTFALGGPAQSAVQPIVAQYIKPIVDQLITVPSKVTLEHVLLSAILIVLIGMWRTQHIAVQHMEANAAKAAKAAKKD